MIMYVTGASFRNAELETMKRKIVKSLVVFIGFSS